jgi:hypothetical protein
MTEAKRKQLKTKVAAGQKRNQDRGRTTIFDRAGEGAIEAKDRFTAFAKEHPIATVAGGLALGILVAGMFRGPRRAAMKGGSKAAGLAALGAEFALAYAQQAMEAATEAGRTAAPKIEELGETIGCSARTAGRAAADKAGDLSESARVIARDTGKRLGKVLRSRFN